MTENPLPRTGNRARAFARGPRFWATTVTVAALMVLFVGSQIARNYGQSVNWYTGFGQWLGALGSFAAAGVALWISTSDRRDRESERLAEEKTHARLVRLTLSWYHNQASLVVKAHNFGQLPVLDVELVDATWTEHPDVKGTLLGTGWVVERRDCKPILKASQGFDDTVETVFQLNIFFGDSEGRPLAEPDPRTEGYLHPNYLPMDFSRVVVRIRFTTANGVRWEIANNGGGTAEPIRIEG